MTICTFIGTGRELKKLINIMLKKKIAYNIKRINYVKDYKLVDNQIVKTEEKIVYIWTDNEEKLKEFLDKEPKFKRW